ncbi:MAG: mycofactocin-associated electron transfer flavoprotein beta subunit [Acidimicrobiia bacterium]
MSIAVCLKLVDTRPELDATGTVHDPDARFTGVSAADQAALEWALRCADAWGDDVHVVTAGPPAADRILRDALATGASTATRIDLAMGAPSEVVAGAMAPLLETAAFVWCGDHSLDRGTGSVPAYLAARLGSAQALGLVDVELDASGPGLAALRRLDGGRRERLRVTTPAVLSVEGSTARLRRAPLAATLRARTAPIDTVPGPPLGEHTHRPTRPFRPRPRTLPAPAGTTSLDRIRELTDAAHGAVHGETVTLDPPEAAERILDSLRAWGYLA